MKRMRRRVFTFCLALSMLLSVMSLALLVRSLFVRDEITWARGGGSLVAIHTWEARLAITIVGPGWPQERNVRWRRVAKSDAQSHETAAWPQGNVRSDHWPGVALYRGQGWFSKLGGRWGGPTYPITTVMLHWAIPAMLFALMPAAAGIVALRRQRLRRRRVAGGLCVACGYDLRGGGERCPECGLVSHKARGTARPPVLSPFPPGEAG